MTEQGGEDTHVDELLFRYLESRDAHPPGAALEALCREHPESADELRALVRTLDDTGLAEPASQDRALGPYRLLRRLGSGGMGVVYLAEDSRRGAQGGHDGPVALKVVRPEQLFFESARERFRRETEAVSRLSHPGIAAVHGFGEVDGVPYLAQEYVAGPSLEEVLRSVEGRDPARLEGRDLLELLERRGEQPLAAPTDTFAGGWAAVCARIAAAAADALEHAHAGGVLHRDVKPSNLLVTAGGRVVLVDFGLAAVADSSTLTRTGSILGSLPYLAPEVLDGGPATVASDVYALGVTLHELVTLARPFDARHPDELRRQVLAADAPRPSLRNPAIPRDLDTIVGCALDRSLGRRYGSARALADDLRAFLAGRPITKRPPGPWIRIRRRLARRPAVAAAGLTGALALVVAPLAYGAVQARHARQVDALNVDLGAALAGQSAARAAAEANFDLAIATVHGLLERFSDEALDAYPALAPLRLEAVEGALGTFATLRAGDPGDRELLEETALALRERGDALFDLRRLDEALDAQREHVTMLEQLATDAPEDAPRLWHEVGIGHSRVARVLGQLGRAPEGVAVHRRAVEWARRAAAAAPGSAEFQLGLASHETNLAMNMSDAMDFDGARALFDGVIERTAALAEALPDEWRLFEIRSRALLQRATPPMAEAGDAGRLAGLDAARRAIERALELRPLDRDLRDDLNRIDLKAAKAHVDLGELERARELLAACEVTSEALAREFPGFPGYTDHLLEVSSLAAQVSMLLGEVASAREALRRAAEWAERHAAAHAEDLSTMSSARAHLVNLSNAYIHSLDLGEPRFELALDAVGRARTWHGRVAERGSFGLDDAAASFHILYNSTVALANVARLEEAEASAAELAAGAADDPWTRRLIADAWCEVLAGFTRGGAGEGPRAAHARAEALRWLRAAVEAGYDDQDELSTTPALDGLRADPAFVALLAALGGRR